MQSGVCFDTSVTVFNNVLILYFSSPSLFLDTLIECKQQIANQTVQIVRVTVGEGCVVFWCIAKGRGGGKRRNKENEEAKINNKRKEERNRRKKRESNQN